MIHVIDIECDSLTPTVIHCMVVGSESFTEYSAMRKFLLSLTEKDRIVGHNFIRYDLVALENILGIKIKAKIVDTLALSWYLYPARNRHGLQYWGEEFSIPKPEVVDWISEPISVYLNRCKEDVKINTALWGRITAFLTELYGEKEYWPLVDYLSFKMHCSALQEHNKWRLNVPAAEALLSELTEKQQEALTLLQKAMPDVQVFRKVTRPKKPFKIDGTLSSMGKKWDAICTEFNIDFNSEQEHKIENGYNPNSITEIKKWIKHMKEGTPEDDGYA